MVENVRRRINNFVYNYLYCTLISSMFRVCTPIRLDPIPMRSPASCRLVLTPAKPCLTPQQSRLELGRLNAPSHRAAGRVVAIALAAVTALAFPTACGNGREAPIAAIKGALKPVGVEILTSLSSSSRQRLISSDCTQITKLSGAESSALARPLQASLSLTATQCTTVR